MGGDQYRGRIRIPSDGEVSCDGFREKVQHCIFVVGSMLVPAEAQGQTSVSGRTFFGFSGPAPSLCIVRGILKRFEDVEGRHLRQRSGACGSGCT